MGHEHEAARGAVGQCRQRGGVELHRDLVTRGDQHELVVKLLQQLAHGAIAGIRTAQAPERRARLGLRVIVDERLPAVRRHLAREAHVA